MFKNARFTLKKARIFNWPTIERMDSGLFKNSPQQRIKLQNKIAKV
jgi:hypothetical protein